MSEGKNQKKFSYPLLGWILLWTGLGVGLSLLFRSRGISTPWANGFAPANFLIFLTLIYYLTRKRFQNFLSNRKKEIKGKIEQAKEFYEQIYNQHQQVKSRWDKIEKEIAQIEKLIAQDGERERAKIFEETQRQIERIKNEAEFTARQELKRARSELKAQMIKWALKEAEQILRQKLTPEKDAQLQEQFLKEVASGELR